MPPLPPTLPQEVQAHITRIQRLLVDVQDVQIPRLRNCDSTLNAQQEYSAEIREDLETLKENIESLEVTTDEQERERDRRDVEQHVSGFKSTLEKLKKENRAALLHSKRVIDSKAQSNREELLRSAVMSEKARPRGHGDDIVMQTSADITEALRRTMGVMQGELEKSVLATQTLQSSTANLKSTSGVYDKLTNVLGASKQLVVALERADWLDRLTILAAFFFFICVVLFVLNERIIKRGQRIALWWTHFVPDFSSDASLGALLEKGEATVSEISQSLSATTTRASILTSVVSTAVASLSTSLTKVSPIASSLGSSDSSVLPSAPLETTSFSIAPSSTTRDEL